MIELKESVEMLNAPTGSNLTLDSLLLDAHEINDRSVDFSYEDFSEITPFTTLQRNGDSDVLKMFVGNEDSGVLSSGVSFTDYSFRQLCMKLGIPARYVKKCFENEDLNMQYLGVKNINDWLERYHSSMLVRTYGDTVRGFLSNRYSVLDTHEIIEVLGETISEDEYRIKGYFMSPERFHLRLVQREQLPINEDLFAGLQIDSSDVGRSTLKVSFMIFKQVCTNGMVITKNESQLFNQRHVGISSDDFFLNLQNSIKHIPGLITDLTNTIIGAREEQVHIIGSNFEEYRKANKYIRLLDLPEKDTLNIIELMANTYTPTKWGLLSAVTDHAKQFTLERRLELEEKAGRLLTA